jgi:hypothetical protein
MDEINNIENSIKFIVNAFKKKKKNDVNGAPNRKYFSEETKEQVLNRQKNRCAVCKKLLTIMDFDHINGDRSDNAPSNCQALCPACHAYKTRHHNNLFSYQICLL